MPNAECRKKSEIRTAPLKCAATRIIHTVGPVWRDGQHREDDLLSSCYRNSLTLAHQHKLRSIAFPAISTGAYGFPLERATKIALTETVSFLENHPDFAKVLFVCFGQAAADCYSKTLRRLAE